VSVALVYGDICRTKSLSDPRPELHNTDAVSQALWLALLLGYVWASGLARRTRLRVRLAEGFQELWSFMKVRRLRTGGACGGIPGRRRVGVEWTIDHHFTGSCEFFLLRLTPFPKIGFHVVL
jgi:hypothetical protein